MISTKRAKQCERSVKRHVQAAHSGSEELWGVNLDDLIQNRGYGSTVPLPGFDDGGNYVENRRVEMRLIEPDQEGYLCPFSIVGDKGAALRPPARKNKATKAQAYAIDDSRTESTAPKKPPSRAPPSRAPPSRAPPSRGPPSRAPPSRNPPSRGSRPLDSHKAPEAVAPERLPPERPPPGRRTPNGPPGRLAPIAPSTTRPGASLFPTGGNLCDTRAPVAEKQGSQLEAPAHQAGNHNSASVSKMTGPTLGPALQRMLNSTESSAPERTCRPGKSPLDRIPGAGRATLDKPIKRPSRGPPPPPPPPNKDEQSNIRRDGTTSTTRVDQVEEKKQHAPRVPKHVGFGGGAAARPDIFAPQVTCSTHAHQGQESWYVAPRHIASEGETSAEKQDGSAPQPQQMSSRPHPSRAPPKREAPRSDPCLSSEPLAIGTDSMPRAPQLRSWEEDNDMDAPTFVNLAAPRVVRLAPVIRSVRTSSQVASMLHSTSAGELTPTNEIPLIHSRTAEQLPRGQARRVSNVPSSLSQETLVTVMSTANKPPPFLSRNKTKGWTSSKSIAPVKSFKLVEECILTKTELALGSEGGGGLRVRPLQLEELGNAGSLSELSAGGNAF